MGLKNDSLLRFVLVLKIGGVLKVPTWTGTHSLEYEGPLFLS